MEGGTKHFLKKEVTYFAPGARRGRGKGGQLILELGDLFTRYHSVLFGVIFFFCSVMATIKFPN